MSFLFSDHIDHTSLCPSELGDFLVALIIYRWHRYVSPGAVVGSASVLWVTSFGFFDFSAIVERRAW
jgi:hypothetical protein